MAADGRVSIEVILEDGSVAKGIADLTNQFDRLGEAPKKANVGVGSLIKSFGLMKIASTAIDAVRGSLDSAISRFDTMQKFPKVMAALGFSAEDSQKSIGKLSDGIDGLPTKLDDVVASTQQMTAITGDLDRSTDTVLALNNAFLASGASADDAARGTQQFNQMLSTGTVDLESWKTLQETMPLALQKTAEAMGYTGKSAQRDLYAALQSGEVTFDEFNDNIIKLGTGTGMLADLAKQNSLGIATSFGNLKNAVAKNVANVITKFDELTQKLTGKTIAQNIDSIKGLINGFGDFVVKSMDGILPVMEAISNSSVWFDLTYWFGLIGQSGSDNIGKLVSVISEKVPSILKYFTDLYESLKEPIWQIMGTIYLISETVIQVFTALLPPILDTAGAIWQNLSGLIIPVLSGIVDAVVNFADSLKIWITETALPAIQGFFDYISQNQGAVDLLTGAIVAAGGAFLAFKGYLAITELINGVKGAIDTLKVSFGLLKAAMATNPFGVIALAIGALIGVIIYLWNTNEGFRNAVITAWTAIQEFMQPIISAIVSFVQTIWGGLVTWWNENQQLILSTAQMIWGAIQVVFNTAMAVIQGVVSVALTAIQAWWNTWGSAVMAIVKVAWAAIKATFQSTLSTIWSIVQGIMRQIQTVISTVMGVIQGVIKVITGAIKGDWSQVWNGIKQITSSILNGIKDTFSNVLSTAASIVSGKIDAIKGFFTSLADVNLLDIGKNIVQGLIDGVSSMIGAVGKAIGNVASTIKDSITGLLGIHSPSRWFRDEIGKMIPPGLAIGIDRAKGVAVDAAADLGNSVKRSISAERIIGTPTTQNTNGAARIAAATTATPVSTEPLVNVKIDATVEMDSKPVGKLVAPHVKATNEKQDRLKSRINGGE